MSHRWDLNVTDGSAWAECVNCGYCPALDGDDEGCIEHEPIRIDSEGASDVG